MATGNVYFPGADPPKNINTNANAQSTNTSQKFAAQAANLAIESYVRDFADHMNAVLAPKGGEDVVGLFYDPRRKFELRPDKYNSLIRNDKSNLLERGWVPLSYFGDANIEELIDAMASAPLYLGISGLKQVPRQSVVDFVGSKTGKTVPTMDVYKASPKYTLRITEILAPNTHPVLGEQLPKQPPPTPPPAPLTVEEKKDIDARYAAEVAENLEDYTVDGHVNTVVPPDQYMELAFAAGIRTRPVEVTFVAQNTVWIRVQAPEEIHPLDVAEAVEASKVYGISLYSCIYLQGGECRIHFKPEDAMAILKSTPSALTEGMEGLEDFYGSVAGFLVEKLGVTESPAAIACCLIQTLSAYAAANTQYRVEAGEDPNILIQKTQDATAKLEDLTKDLVLILEAIIQMSAVPNMDTSQLWSILLNVTAMIYNAAVVAVSGTLLFAWREVAMFMFETIRKWYTDMTTKPAWQQAAFSAVRCFALDEMFLKLVEAFTGKAKKVVSELASSFQMKGTSTPVATLTDSMYAPSPQLLYLKALLIVLRAINKAVAQGELCFNKGFTDIPRIDSNNKPTGDGRNDETETTFPAGPGLGKAISGSDEPQGFADLFGGQASPLSDEGYATVVNGAGGNDGSQTNSVSTNRTNPAPTFGVAGPTDEEMIGFFVNYLNMSSTEARTTIRQHADNRNCKEKLSSEQAGQLGSILARVGLEL